MSTSGRADCGCWVDSDGYWRLSPACQDVERKIWEDLMSSSRGFRAPWPKVMTYNEERADWRTRAHIYFRQELHDNVE